MAVSADEGRISGFGGRVVTPADAGYDDARAVWNAMHDRRPAVIAYCATEQDVVAAVAHARAHGLTVAVRSGGHSMPGHSVCDDGIVIDLRGLAAIAVDPVARVARVGGGALLGEVDAATQAHGLVVPAGVVSHTGVGGLTLGGGVGRLMRRFGLTIDSLRAARVVTADGRILRAAEDENADLFWGLRGGGGNFGIVTSFQFTLHPLRDLLILGTFHHAADIGRVLARGREAMSDGAPRELLWTSFLRKAPPLPWIAPEMIGRPGVMSLIEWSGAIDAGRELLAPLAQELAPAAHSLEVIPFLTMQTMTDEIFAAGKRTYIKAGFLDELTDDAIATLGACGAEVSSELSQIEVLALGGAIADVAPEASAYPHRRARWLINLPAMWESPADTDAEVAWARRSYGALTPHLTGGTYVNFMDGDEADAAADAYGALTQRLRAVKRAYDPTNLFHLNQNIAPA